MGVSNQELIEKIIESTEVEIGWEYQTVVFAKPSQKDANLLNLLKTTFWLGLAFWSILRPRFDVDTHMAASTYAKLLKK